MNPVETHDEIMQAITACKTSDQLKEVKDVIMYNRHLGLGVKHFYFKKIEAQQRMLPLINNMEKRGITFTPKSLI